VQAGVSLSLSLSPPPLLLEERRTDDEEGSVEEDGVGVPVGDLRHVLQDVLFSDDAQKPPRERERE